MTPSLNRRHFFAGAAATAVAAASDRGARLNNQPDSVQHALRDYGLKLGTAYQIYDDCLDIVGDEKTVGKTLRTDLARGKLTLPILYLLEGATDAQKQKLIDAAMSCPVAESIHPDIAMPVEFRWA